MSDSPPAPIVSEFSKVDFLRIASFTILILFPALKTFASLTVEEKRALAYQMKWAYYWITVPYLVIIYLVADLFLKNYLWFHVLSLILSVVFSFNNGFITRQLTVLITSKIYKKYYRQIKKIPQLFGKILKKFPNLVLALLTGNKQEEEPVQANVRVHRRPKTVS